MDYLFAFNHDEARRSFQRAADLDPQAAMPLWGVALAVGPNYNDIDIGHAREQQALAAITRATQLAAQGPQTESTIESDYIAALASRYAQSPNQSPAHNLKIQGEQYAQAMATLVHQHPDDLDAATLYAESLMDLHPWQLWTAAGQPAPNTQVETIVATLQSVLLRDPNHIGANHFLIHAVEASADPSLALPSAERLKTLAPAAGHLVHMPAHIYQRVGDFNASATATHQPTRAAAERQALAAALQSLPANAIPDFNNSAPAVLQLALTALDARIAESKGDLPHAIALWQTTVTALDTFAYNEPADWYYPTRESLGGALLRNHQPAQAEAVFRRDLQQNPKNGRSLYGLWQALLQQHKAADAALLATQFQFAWKHADTALTINAL